jgi:hypothetical protein
MVTKNIGIRIENLGETARKREFRAGWMHLPSQYYLEPNELEQRTRY